MKKLLGKFLVLTFISLSFASFTQSASAYYYRHCYHCGYGYHHYHGYRHCRVVGGFWRHGYYHPAQRVCWYR